MKLKFVLPAGVLIAGLVMMSSVSYGTAEYTKKEKKPCATCHVGAGKKELNDVGKHYKEHKELPK